MQLRLKFIIILAIVWNTIDAQQVPRYSIVIDELFPDPSPSVGLPSFEFIELKNVSTTPVELRNFKISDGTSIGVINASFVLYPDSFVIICPIAAVVAYQEFGSTIGISSFPSLNNDADQITLYDPPGSVIHCVNYNISWYNNGVKSDGGWTIEMIDPTNPCATDDNWKASNALIGGTPGTVNSIDRLNIDDQFPALIRAYAIDSITTIVQFDESLDSASASISSKYSVSHGIGNSMEAMAIAPLFKEVRLRFSSLIQQNQVYELSVNSVVDCAGNVVGAFNKTKLALPSVADSLDIVLNELLFNPRPDGFDYIEIYNNSNKPIDCRQLYIANRNSSGSIVNSIQLTNHSMLLFPKEYLLLTENIAWTKQHYPVKNILQLLELHSLPSMPDDKGILVLLNHRGSIIDEVQYDHRWHFPLLSDKEGVALERISYSQQSQSKTNWTSASSNSGFGTPGYQNSQFLSEQSIAANISLSPKIFSPDNDGIDDLLRINIQMDRPGYIATITIYDANGTRVKNLINNQSLSMNAQFLWNGLNDSEQKLARGIYVVVLDLFNLEGRSKKYKIATIIK